MLRDRGVYTHPPSRKEPTGAAKITTAAKRNAAQSKIKFRRPKQIRYKRIQPPKTILHTSLNTRKSSPFFASDRNRSGSILRSVPQASTLIHIYYNAKYRIFQAFFTNFILLLICIFWIYVWHTQQKSTCAKQSNSQNLLCHIKNFH